MNLNDLSWDYDFKKTLLGENYDENEPIKNILRAKEDENYTSGIAHHKGHIENYQVVGNVFQTLLGKEIPDSKDVMNSFWTTYKCLLQLEYPEYFMPVGDLKEGTPDLIKFRVKKAPNIGYSPFAKGKYERVHDKYIKYYKVEFPDLKINPGDTWFNFLLNNFDRFPKVHNSEELKLFAKSTHSIGNITVVPKGFNVGRGAYDYWDWGLKFLEDFLLPIEAWMVFIDKYCLDDYVDDEYQIKPFWEDHLVSGSYLLPQNKRDIEDFLKFANKAIESRGQKIMDKINQ